MGKDRSTQTTQIGDDASVVDVQRQYAAVYRACRAIVEEARALDVAFLRTVHAKILAAMRAFHLRRDLLFDEERLERGDVEDEEGAAARHLFVTLWELRSAIQRARQEARLFDAEAARLNREMLVMYS